MASRDHVSPLEPYKNKCFFKEKALVNPISYGTPKELKAQTDDELGFYDCEYYCLVADNCEAFFISKEDGSCQQVSLDEKLMVGSNDPKSELVYSSKKIDFAFGKLFAYVNLKYCPSFQFFSRM